MAHPPDAPSGTFASSDDSSDPDPSEGSSRGLFTRLREVFSPPDSQGSSAANGHLSLSSETSIHKLRRMRVEDVAIPSADIIAVPVTISLEDLVETFRSHGLTRIPVYEGNLDAPIGLVNLKDLALRHGFSSDAPFDLRAILRELLYVPPSMVAGVLLQKMQAERKHMALVIDEYGGTDGLITIEDLLEIVVGEIDDEHDTLGDAPFVQDKDGTWLVQANTDIEDFGAAIRHNLTAHATIDGEEVDTVGGLVFMLAGHVPEKGEVVMHPDGLIFEVIDADPRRVRRVRVSLPADLLPAHA